MQRNIEIRHVLGWSIKKCGSFWKYVVLISKTVATRYIFNKLKCSTTVLADGRIVNKFLQKNWWNCFVETIGKTLR